MFQSSDVNIKVVEVLLVFTVVSPDGVIDSIEVTAGGAAYTSPPDVAITGGGGHDAHANALISGGVVVEIIVTSPGSGFTSAPTVSITGGGGAGATATAKHGGVVDEIFMTNPGVGYSLSARKKWRRPGRRVPTGEQSGCWPRRSIRAPEAVARRGPEHGGWPQGRRRGRSDFR